MSYLDLMKDPYYAALLYRIESALSKADREAEAAGVSITNRKGPASGGRNYLDYLRDFMSEATLEAEED